MTTKEYLSRNAYLQRGEHQYIESVVKSLPHKPMILEIGTFRGFSAILMAKAREDAKIITIDNHIGTEDNFKSSFCEVNTNLTNADVISQVQHTPISSYDFQLEKCELDLLFIDGGHSYLEVKHDFEKFMPKVRNNGLIVFHDYGVHKGVTDFVNSLGVRGGNRFKSLLLIKKSDIYG